MGVGGLGSGDRTFYVQGVKNATAGTGIGCKTSIVQVIIPDQHITPALGFTSVPNTSCDNNFDGKITIAATDASGPGVGKNYDFIWTSIPPLSSAANAPNTPSAYSTTGADKIGAGTFNINVTNTFTGCLTPGSLTTITTPQPVAILTTTKLDQTLCKPDGQIVVTAVSPNSVADFTYLWYLTSLSTPPLQDGTPATIVASSLTTANYATIGAGTYFITGTKLNNGTGGSGCVTPPLQVAINDISVQPTVTLTPFTNTSCDASFEGKITVLASDSGGPGAGQPYAYVWDPANPVVIPNTGVNNGNGSGADGDGDAPVNLKDGTYNLTVTNNVTNCVTIAQTTLLQSNTPILAVIASSTDQMICNPDGKITVGDVSVNNVVDGNHNDFNFDWYQNDTASPPIVSGLGVDVLSTANFAAMGKGTYFVVVTRNSGLQPGSGCVSPPLRVDINDVHVNPTIAAATLNANLNCTGAAGTGQITINEATPANYAYSWFTGDNITGTPVGVAPPGNVVQNLSPGDYTVQVRSNATNCVSIERYTISNNPTSVSFDPAGFSAPAVTTCTLATGAPSNGTATVTAILENNVNQPLTNYAFTWTDAANTVLPNSPLPTLAGAPPGSYFVRATNTVTNCIADHSFNIDDNTIGSTVTLISFGAPEKCVNPKTGFLTAQGGGTWPGLFTYEWYAGDSTTSARPGWPLLWWLGIPCGATSLLHRTRFLR